MLKPIFIETREKLAQAYDFALEKIGMDLHSYSIWADYIAFLKSVEAVGSYAENQKITAVRKVNFKSLVLFEVLSHLIFDLSGLPKSCVDSNRWH